jgi:hypothetical protein
MEDFKKEKNEEIIEVAVLGDHSLQTTILGVKIRWTPNWLTGHS